MAKNLRLCTVVVSCLSALLVTACGGSKFSNLDVAEPAHEIRTFAIAPHSGVVGEHLSTALKKHGYRVLGIEDTYRVIQALDLQDIDSSRPDHLRKLQTRDIDAYLITQTSFEQWSGKPSEVDLSVFSTHQGTPIISFTWENAWAGARGSPADHNQRKDVEKTANEIASRIILLLP